MADIPGTLIERPWVNFGHNRSEAFALARGTADWLLALDADMTVEMDDWTPDPEVAAYTLRMGDGPFANRLPLLLRGDLAWKSVGAVHEYTCLDDGTLGRREPTDHVRISLGPDRSSPAKTLWQAGMLEAETNPRTLFYLAQSYRELGRLMEARDLYRIRSRMGGWDQERWYAAWMVASLDDWPAKLSGLLTAWESRPARLEPLYDALCALNEHGQHLAAYRLSDVPLTPSTDDLFVHRAVWDWGITFQRSVAAWWIGRRDEAAELSRGLLTKDLPEHVRADVERNLSLPS